MLRDILVVLNQMRRDIAFNTFLITELQEDVLFLYDEIAELGERVSALEVRNGVLPYGQNNYQNNQNQYP